MRVHDGTKSTGSGGRCNEGPAAAIGAADWPWRRPATWIVAGLLAAGVFLVFGQTLRHEFVNYDDADYVYENPHVARGISDENIVWAFTQRYAFNWHPLTWLSHMLDCQVYGL